jgi:hypothetical protein
MCTLHAWSGNVDILRSHGSRFGNHIPGYFWWDIIMRSAGQSTVTASCAFGLIDHHSPLATVGCERFEGSRPSYDLRPGQNGCAGDSQFDEISAVDFYVAHFLVPFLFILW